ncbi:MAG TPA: response regulator transcription factor, partial [Pyrinomonadaceae bacterium]|nr:response regulator transcription factor [Pyrinomonadaceae bacterium]
RAAAARPDLILLDVMLPGRSGLDVCRDLRGRGMLMPIIMLTARGQEVDKVVGLEIGADDYVTKPFSIKELLARVRAQLRRAGSQARAAACYEFGGVRLDFEKYLASKDGRRLELSPREFAILEFFVRHRGETVTRERLLDEVWGYNCFPATRTVDNHISKLRQKIEDTPADPQYLITVHRIGYRFLG